MLLRKSSLAVQLSIAFAVLLILAGAAAILYDASLNQKQLIDSASTNATGLASAKAETISRTLDTETSDLIYLADNRIALNFSANPTTPTALADMRRLLAETLTRTTNRYSRGCVLDAKGQETICIAIINDQAIPVNSGRLESRAAGRDFTEIVKLIHDQPDKPARLAFFDTASRIGSSTDTIPVIRYVAAILDPASHGLSAVITLEAKLTDIVSPLANEQTTNTYAVIDNATDLYLYSTDPQQLYKPAPSDLINPSQTATVGDTNLTAATSITTESLHWTLILALPVAPIQDAVNKAERTTFLIGGLLLAAGVLIAFGLTGRLVRPLTLLTQTVRTIDQSGNYDIQLPPPGTATEVTQLSSAFGALLATTRKEISTRRIAEANAQAETMRAQNLAATTFELNQSPDDTAFLNALSCISKDDLPQAGTLWRLTTDPSKNGGLEYCASLDNKLTQPTLPTNLHPLYLLWSNSNQPLIIGNTATDTRLTDEIRAKLTNTRTLLIIPLKTVKGWQGLVELHWTSPHEFTPLETYVYTAIPPTAAAIMSERNALAAAARAQAAASRRARDMGLIAAIAGNATNIEPGTTSERLLSNIALASAMSFHVDVIVYLISQDNNLTQIAATDTAQGPQSIPIANNQAAPAQAVRTRRITLDNAARAADGTLRSQLSAPMMLGDHLLGVLDFQAPGPDHFDNQDKSVMLSLASMIAVAYENASLYEREADNARRLGILSNTKTLFLSTMSHELRTPLNVIVGYAEWILQVVSMPTADNDSIYDFSGIDPMLAAELETGSDVDSVDHRAVIETAQEIIQAVQEGRPADGAASRLLGLFGIDRDDLMEKVSYIRKGGLTLLALVNGLLDLAKIEAGHIDIIIEPFDIREVITEIDAAAIALAGPTVHYSSIVDIDVPDIITSDKTHMATIVRNLISNAFKFTTEGEIELTIRSASTNTFMISVRDTGIGIAPDQRDRIFESFVQAEAGTSRAFGGTGLGLAIVRQLCTALGGTIRVESKLKEGSEFIVTLPKELSKERGK